MLRVDLRNCLLRRCPNLRLEAPALGQVGKVRDGLRIANLPQRDTRGAADAPVAVSNRLDKMRYGLRVANLPQRGTRPPTNIPIVISQRADEVRDSMWVAKRAQHSTRDTAELLVPIA